jgi:dolichol-phosphate mannosyltransferase
VSLIQPTLALEIILVDDGSTDKSWEVIQELVQINVNGNKIIGLKLLSNYGQPTALIAGLEASTGEFIVTMDSDLQHPPEVILEMWQQRFKAPVIAGRQTKRSEKYLKGFLSKRFYSLIRFISDLDIEPNVGDFRLISREALIEIKKVLGTTKIIRFAISRLRFPVYYVNFESNPRTWGTSSYTVRKMFGLATDSIITTTTRPLLISVYISLLLGLISLFDFIYVLFVWQTNGAIPGWASVMGLITLGFCVTFLVLGIQSLYLSKIIAQSQNYPHYLISSKVTRG